MANYRCIGSFSQAGIYYEIGQVIDSSAAVVTQYPSKWTPDNVETTDITYAEGAGPCLNATDGTKVYRVEVNNAGTLTATEVV